MTTIQKFFIAILPLPFTTLGLNLLTLFGQYVPELFFIIYMILYVVFVGKFNNIKKILLNKSLLLTLFILSGISLLSLFHQNFDFINFYGRFRAIFFAILAFFFVRVLVSQNQIEELEKGLLIFSSSAAIMYVISALITVQSDVSKFGVSMLCFAIAICLSLEKKNYTLATILVLLSSLAAYLSFFRQNYFLALLFLFFYIIVIISKNHIFSLSKKLIAPVVLFTFSLFLIIYNIDYFVQYLQSSESRYIQSIGKMNDLLGLVAGNGLDESSSLRLQSYLYLYNNMPYLLLPNGLINDSILSFQSIWGGDISKLEMSISRDSILAYFIINFGIIISLILVFNFFIGLMNSISLNPKKTILRFLFVFPPLIVVFFFDGATLTQLQKSVFWGLSIALVLYPGKLEIYNLNR